MVRLGALLALAQCDWRTLDAIVGGADAGDDGLAADAPMDSAEAATPVCSAPATQCVGNAVQSCGSEGQWGSAISCEPSTNCIDGGCAAIPSCQAVGPGLTDCGALSESCCTSLEVTGGTYYRTYVNDGGGPSGEADPATVSSFRLDKYLVTVGRFRQFVAAYGNGSGWTPAVGSGKHTHLNEGRGLSATGGGYEPGWVASDSGFIAPTTANLACPNTATVWPPNVDAGVYGTWTVSQDGQETLPINCVNWYTAYAFCIWDGGFLPSEAESEYAATGGGEQREYPWGADDPGTSNLYAVYGCYYPSGSGTCFGVTSIAPVGTPTLGAGLWGQLDLVGSLWEWNLDWYAPTFVDPCTDCANLTTATQRSKRGSDFNTPTIDLRSTLRGEDPPNDLQAYAYGIRCARTP